VPTPELGLTNRPWQLSELNQQHHAAGSQIEEHAPARGAGGGGGDGTRIGNFLAGVKTWLQQATGTQRDSRLEAARRIENFVQRDTHTNRLDLSNLGLSDLPPNFKLLAQVSQLRHALPDVPYIQLEGNAFDAQTQALLPNLQAECHGRLGFGGGRTPARAGGVQPVRSHQDNAKHCRALLEVMDAVQAVTLPRFASLCQPGVDVAGTMALNETILRTTAQYNTLVNKLNSKISRHANLKINATCLKAQPGRTVLFNLEQLAHHGSELRKLSDSLATAKPGFFGSKTGVKAAQELLIQLQKIQYEAEKTCEVVELVSSGLRNIASAQSDLEDKLFESEIDAIRNQLQSTPINEVLENALEHVVHADALVSTRHQALLALRQQVAAALAELSRCDSSQPTVRAAQQWLDQTEGNVAALQTEKNLLMAVSKLANPNTARLMLNYSTTTLTKAVKELPGNSPYLAALLQHHQKQIRSLVTSRPDYVEPPPPPALWTTLPKVNVKHTLMAQYSLQTQAFDAVRTGDLQKLHGLLQQGVNPQAQDNDGNTLLHAAAMRGQRDTIRFLVSTQGVDLHASNKQGKTPFLAAFEVGQDETAAMLEDLGASPDTPVYGNGQSALLRAAETGNLANMGRLLKLKANADATDRQGNKAIDLAAACANPETLDYCKQELGQKLEEPGLVGRTPFLNAASQGKVDNMTWLLAQKANANATDNNGSKAIHLAASFANPETLIYCQQELGQKLEEPGLVGRTPLLHAAAHGKVENMTWLLAQKVNARAKDKNGDKAIHLAAGFANPETLIYCQQELGRKLEEPGYNGRTPFLHAASQGKVENMTWLLAQGANAHATDRHGKKAIDLALAFNHPDAVALCRQWGQ